jgi:hypothetical protein
MKNSPQIRLAPDRLAQLLAGNEVETTFRGPKCPELGESYPVTLQEPTRIRVVVAGSKLRPKCLRIWTLRVELDDTEPPLLLNAESKGGVIIPLSDKREETETAAHGYVSTPGRHVLDAGEGVDPDLVEMASKSQESTRRFAKEQVHKLAKRRARALTNRVHDVLMQAQAHGVDPDIEGLEAWIEQHANKVKEAA